MTPRRGARDMRSGISGTGDDKELTRSIRGAAVIDHHDESERAMLARVADDPRYRDLVRERSRFGWTLTIIMMVVFFGYISLIAYDKAFLARPAFGGTTTLGIPIGIGVILIAILLTGIYVRRANRRFDPAMRTLLQDEGL